MSDEAIFYAIPGSHAAHTGHLMLEHKGIPFRRINLVPGFHRVYVRVRGFPGDRVPAVLFADGRRAQGTRPLARALDEIRPEPRLVPDDSRVEEAERWGDDVLQQWARRMVVDAGVRDPDLLHEHGGAGRLGPPSCAAGLALSSWSACCPRRAERRATKGSPDRAASHCGEHIAVS